MCILEGKGIDDIKQRLKSVRARTEASPASLYMLISRSLQSWSSSTCPILNELESSPDVFYPDSARPQLGTLGASADSKLQLSVSAFYALDVVWRLKRKLAVYRPPHLRLLVVNVVALFWNAYLSYANASSSGGKIAELQN